MNAQAFVCACMALVAILIGDASVATAQAGRGSPQRKLTRSKRPTISPTLDLLGGAGLGTMEFQYLRRVRPEQQFRQTEQKLSQSLQTLQNQVDAGPPTRQSQAPQQPVVGSGLTPTGHSVSFNNYAGYYNLGASSRSGGRR